MVNEIQEVRRFRKQPSHKQCCMYRNRTSLTTAQALCVVSHWVCSRYKRELRRHEHGVGLSRGRNKHSAC